MIEKVKIKRNTNGDTRVAVKVPTFEKFKNANYSHWADVNNMMDSVSKEIRNTGANHDWTKIREPNQSMFYRDLCNTIEGRMNFEDGEWSKSHYSLERHHLLRNCPENVNLIDVLEMICDCVCAGMARSGSVCDLEISPEILEAAVRNTVEMCKEAVELED